MPERDRERDRDRERAADRELDGSRVDACGSGVVGAEDAERARGGGGGG